MIAARRNSLPNWYWIEVFNQQQPLGNAPGANFYDRGRLATVYNSDKNNIFVVAFSKADDVVTISRL